MFRSNATPHALRQSPNSISPSEISSATDRIIGAIERALARQGRPSTPELALSGYPPEDPLLRPDFIAPAAGTQRTLTRQATCGWSPPESAMRASMQRGAAAIRLTSYYGTLPPDGF